MTTEVKKIKKDLYDNKENVIVPPVDIYLTDNEYIVKADMPAVKKENIEITLHDNKLDISGKIDNEVSNEDNLKYSEYTLYNYHRSFNVGNDIDGNAISAKIDNGVLTLTLPKREEVKPKKIEIAVE